MIKAIETVYNGYKFRSRLEARWAVFFDTLGLEYQYEAEGFEIGNIGRYLPDFWLPEDDIYFEVKPTINNKTWRRIKKDPERWLGFSNAINKKIFVCFGEPFPYKFDVFFTMRYAEGDFGWFFWRNAYFIVHSLGMLISIDVTNKEDRGVQATREMWGVPEDEDEAIITTHFCEFPKALPIDGNYYEPIEAYRAARQARFGT